MRGSLFVGRVGCLAIALGVGAAIAGGGVGTAWAEPAADPATTDSAATAPAGRADTSRTRSVANGHSSRTKKDRPSAVKPAPAAAARVPVVRVDVREVTALTEAAQPASANASVTAASAMAAAPALAAVAQAPRTMAPTPVIAGMLQSLAAGLAGINPLVPAAPVESPVAWAVAAATSRRTIGAQTQAQARATAAATGNPIATFFFNQTPTLSPTRIGQDSASVVTGDFNINDPDSDVVVYTVTKEPVNGTVTVDTDGRYTYIPDTYYGRVGTTDTFTVSVSDADSGFHLHGIGGLFNLLTFGLLGESGHASTSTVTVVVDPRNTAPVATATVGAPDPVTGRVTGQIIGNDDDGDPLGYATSTAPAKGAVVISADGSFTYTPTSEARHEAARLSASDADKADTFAVVVSDPYGGQAIVTARVDIAPLNEAPIASYTADDPNSSTGTVTGRISASDPDGDPVNYSGSAATSKGVVTVNPDGSFVYTPTAAARHGAALSGASVAERSDTFVLTVRDDSGGSTGVSVTVTLSPANIAPVASGVSVGSPDATSGVVAGNISASDGDGDALSYIAAAAKGTVIFSSDGSFRYTPSADARHAAASLSASEADKTETFAVTVSDGHGGQVSVAVKVDISPLNEAPVAEVVVGSPEPGNGTVVGRINATDPDGDPLTYSGTATTPKGSVNVAADGSFTYAPTAAARHGAARLSGSVADKTDTFTITVSDGSGGSTSVSVTVTLSPANIAPVASGVSVGSPDATSGVVAGNISASDGDGDPLSYSAVPSKGSVSFSANGNFSYSPTAQARQDAANGGPTTDSFTVTIADGYGGTATIPLTVGIAPALAPATLAFNFSYGSGSQYWTADARAALESAAASLASYFVVNSPRIITVTVTGNNTPNSNNLAYASVGFTSYSAGYYGTIVQSKIITGVDSNGASADALISYNWAQPWALGNSVPNNQYDFKAVAIHELLHTVGFLTGADNSPNNVNWTTYDRFLRTAGGTAVIDPNTYAVISGYQGNFTGAGGGLYFTGPNAGTVKLYTPGTWSDGSSVSHVNQLGGYVMNPFSSTGPGPRVLSATEVGILRDLGFSVNNSPGVAAFVVVWVGLVRRRRTR